MYGNILLKMKLLIASERLFRGSGRIVTTDRNSVAPKTLELKLKLTESNNNIVQFVYSIFFKSKLIISYKLITEKKKKNDIPNLT